MAALAGVVLYLRASLMASELQTPSETIRATFGGHAALAGLFTAELEKKQKNPFVDVAANLF